MDTRATNLLCGPIQIISNTADFRERSLLPRDEGHRFSWNSATWMVAVLLRLRVLGSEHRAICMQRNVAVRHPEGDEPVLPPDIHQQLDWKCR